MRDFLRISLPLALRAASLCALSLAAGCSSPDLVEEDVIDVERYDLKGQFDWNRNVLSATLTVTLRTTADGLSHVVLDSEVTHVKSVRVVGGDTLSFEVDDEARKLRVDVESLGAGSGTTIAIAIDYEAATGASLVAIPVREGDPLAVRALYSASEPEGARRWMPCHDRPSDRAVFSADLQMDTSEKLIANGALVSDTLEGAGHRMKYETGYTLPTYLMAFAVADFEVETVHKGALPVSVWHRRGLPGDYTSTLSELSQAIESFEKLLGPYPFEKYALVVLPEFPGGLENAGVTFQTENSVQALSGDLFLSNHELGHQWFGDLVTVATWDDVWIKEGMATLLAVEGARPHLDESGRGTLNGDLFFPQSGEAIRDASLAPGDKYTSGPYDRAAWLLTQIRSVVGEEKFWATLRGILDEHRFGTVSTDEFLAAFAPALGPDLAARARRAVDAKALPTLTVTQAGTAGPVVTLHDPEGAFLTPMNLQWISAAGTTRTQALEADQSLDLTPQGDEYLILDPSDRHPVWSAFFDPSVDSGPYDNGVLPRTVPENPKQVLSFLDIGGANQRVGLQQSLPPIAPDELASFVEGLDEDPARVMALKAACSTGAGEEDPAVKAAWAAVITTRLETATSTWGLDFLGVTRGYADCDALVTPELLFGSEYQKLQTDATVSAKGDARLAFLAQFTISPALALSTWGNVARTSNSLRARRLAIRYLTRYRSNLDPATLLAFRALFVDVLNHSEVPVVLGSTISAVYFTAAPTAAENAAALDGLRRVLENRLTSRVHEAAVCAAFSLTQGDEVAFAVFVEELKKANLSVGAQKALQDPSTCR